MKLIDVHNAPLRATLFVNSQSPRLLRYCMPTRFWEMPLLIVLGISLMTMIVVTLSGPFDELDLSYVALFVFAVFALMSRPLERLIKITRSLRFLKIPNANVTLVKVLSWLGFLWTLVFLLVSFFKGWEGFLLASALTVWLVMIYAQAFYDSNVGFLHLICLLSVVLRSVQDLHLFLLPAMALGLVFATMSIRAARPVWQRQDFALADPLSDEFTKVPSLRPISAAVESNIANEMKPDAWTSTLRCFGLVSLRAHLRWVGIIVLIVGMFAIAVGLVLGGSTYAFWQVLIPVVVSIMLLANLDTQMMALYACKKEREFLQTLPGLPAVEVQSRRLLGELWHRFAISFALLTLAMVVLVIGLSQSKQLFFCLTIVACGIIGARIVEARVAWFATSGESGSGIFGALAIVLGAFLAVFAQAADGSGMLFGLAFVLCLIACFLPRDKLAMALSTRE